MLCHSTEAQVGACQISFNCQYLQSVNGQESRIHSSHCVVLGSSSSVVFSLIADAIALHDLQA